MPYSARTSGGERRPLRDRSLTVIDALSRAMSARDGSTHQHAQRVQRYAVALAGDVGVGGTQMIEAIAAAALLHDIGKLGIPDCLIHKPGPLTPDEYEQVKQHAVIGADILTAVPFDGPLALIVRHHHENWDGTGYPDNLAGEGIPIGARILSVVDCYDALTSDRPYRRALPHERATNMIQASRGTMYDPAIVDVFLRIVQRLRSGPAADRTDRLSQSPRLYEVRAV